MADYKIVGNKYYVYPDTNLEQSFMNGEASFPSEKELYVQLGTAFDTIKTEYPDNIANIHTYDYYLVCIRTPEWAPDGSVAYKAIIVNDEYGLNYKAYYANPYAEITDLSRVEVGKSIYFTTYNPDYNASFLEGLDVTEYAYTEEHAIVYKFRMPDYDVEISTVPAHVEVTFVDESGMDMGVQAYYLDNPEETIDVWTGEPVLVDNGRPFILASDHPDYNVTTTEGITFEDYDVMQGQIKVNATADGTVTFINGGGFGIKVTDLDNAGWWMTDTSYQALPSRIPEGTEIIFAVRNYVYTAESQETYVRPNSAWNPQYTQYTYAVTMPTEAVEISVVERQNATVTVTNPDSVVFGLYDEYAGWQSFQSGDKIRTDYRQYNLYVDNPSYDAIITGANITQYEPKTNPDGWKILFITDPQYDAVTIDIEEHIPVYSEITLVNNDSISYDVDPNTIDFQSVEDRTQFDIYVNNVGYQLTSDIVDAITSEERDWDNDRWKYSIKMPAEDMTLTISARPVHLETVKNNSVSSNRVYNITQQMFMDDGWDPNACGGDTIAILDDSGVSGFNPNCFYKAENPQTFTQLTRAGSETMTIKGTTYNAVKFVLPVTISNGDDLIFTDSTEALYDVVINTSDNVLYVAGNWWNTVEDDTDPQNPVWRTKLPENTDVGVESRNYQSYSFSPSVTLNSGGAVGKYFTMPSSNLTITYNGYDYPDYKIYVPNDWNENVMINGGWARKLEDQGQYYYYADAGNAVKIGTAYGTLTLSVSPNLTNQTVTSEFVEGEMPPSDVTVTVVS